MPPDSHWNSTLEEVREDVKTILNYLHGQQGNNGLMTRTKVLENRVDEHESRFRSVTGWLVGTITTVALAILGWFVSKGGEQ